MGLVSSKQFLEIQPNIECGFTLKHVRDIMIKTYSQIHRTEKYLQHGSVSWLVWLNCLMFVQELSSYRFESCCVHQGCFLGNLSKVSKTLRHHRFQKLMFLDERATFCQCLTFTFMKCIFSKTSPGLAYNNILISTMKDVNSFYSQRISSKELLS